MKTVYRVVTPIFCVLIFPVLFFLPMFRISISSALSQNLMSSLGLSEYISIKSLFDMYNSGSEKTVSTIKSVWEALFSDNKSEIVSNLTNLKFAYIFAALLLLLIVLAIVLMCFAIFSKKYTLCTILSAATVICCFAMNKSFDAFAKPLLSGEIGLNSIMTGLDSTLTSLFSLVANISYLQMGIVYPALMLIFCIILILSVCVLFEVKYDKN